MKRTASFCLVLLAILLASSRPARAADLEKLTVLVPDDGNLQFMSFWIAKHGGFFEREGLDVEVTVAPSPQQMRATFEAHSTDAAILPPPMYGALIADKYPVVLVANLLRNDPINLIVRKKYLDEHKVTKDMPVRDRLEALKGMKIGVGPHPVNRLKVLYKSQGFEPNEDIEIVTLQGKEQNKAFAAREVDALYTHSPFLERAIVHDDAVVVVYQTRGIVPEVACAVIHMLGFHKDYLDQHRDVAARAYRALGAADASIHRSETETVTTLAKGFPAREKKELETIVHLYESAMPAVPGISVEAVKKTLDLYPIEGRDKVDFKDVDITPYLATDVATEAKKAPGRNAWFVVFGIAAAVAVVIMFSVLRSKRGAAKKTPETPPPPAQ